MYRLTTYGTEVSGGLQLDKVLVGGSISEGGVRPLVVVEELVVDQAGSDAGDGDERDTHKKRVGCRWNWSGTAKPTGYSTN